MKRTSDNGRIEEAGIFTVAGAPQAVLAQAGAFVLWRLSGNVDVIKMNEAWLDAGLDPHQCPEAPSEEVAHHRAVKEHARGGALCQKVADGGWALIGKHDTQDAAGGNLRFSTELRVWQGPAGGLKFEPDYDARKDAIASSFALHQQTLSSVDISVWLVGQAERLDAVPLRDTGGVYFIPHSGLDEWTQIVRVLRTVSGHKVFNIPALKNDADSIALILDGVQQDTEALLSAVQKDLTEYEAGKSLGKRAWRSRKQQLEKLEEKLKRYENLLGIKLEGVRQSVDAVGAEVSYALIAVAASLP